MQLFSHHSADSIQFKNTFEWYVKILLTLIFIKIRVQLSRTDKLTGMEEDKLLVPFKLIGNFKKCVKSLQNDNLLKILTRADPYFNSSLKNYASFQRVSNN